MKSRIALVALFACLVTHSATPQVGPSPLVINVSLVNNSDRCIWETLYFSKPVVMPWIAGFTPRPKFIKPGDTEEFVVSVTDAAGSQGIDWEVKARAEFMRDRHCNGPVVKDTDREVRFNRKNPRKPGMPSGAVRITCSLTGRDGQNYKVASCSVRYLN